MNSMWHSSHEENLHRTVHALDLRPDDRVLMLRCAHERLVVPILDALLAACPEVTIDLLTTQQDFIDATHSIEIVSGKPFRSGCKVILIAVSGLGADVLSAR